jgi:hypothetical protein
MSDINPDRLTYSETRTINIGQYENIRSSFTISGSIREFNKVDKTIEITEDANIALNIPEGEITLEHYNKSIKNTARLLKRNVIAALNKRETEIRQATRFAIYQDDDLEKKSYVEYDDGELI